MKRSNKKKGFTLVELIVVIAILAILATVSIVGYVSFLKKAKVSNDISLTKQLNDMLMAGEVSGKPATMSEALALVEEDFNVEKITPTADGYSYVWDSTTNRFALFDKDGRFVAGTEVANKALAFAVVHNKTQLDDAATKGYGVYLASDYDGTEFTLDKPVSLDVGKSGVNNVSVRFDAEGTIMVSTNGGDLTVNAPKATVHHYGNVNNVTIEAVAPASYHEHGTVIGNLVIQKGKLELTKQANVNAVLVKSAAVGDVAIVVVDGATVGTVAPMTESAKTDISNSSTVPAESKTDEVVEQLSTAFAGGLGTEKSPFIVATSAHFSNIVSKHGSSASKKVYFKLLNDLIDVGCTTLTSGNIEIDLGGHTLSAKKWQSTLDVNSATVVIKNGTIEATPSIAGSALSASGTANVTVINCTIKTNGNTSYAVVTNGANSLNSKIIVKDSTITAPTVSGAKGYAAYIPAGDVTFKNCNVTGHVFICGGNVTLDGGTYTATGFNTQSKIWHKADTIDYVSKSKNGTAFNMGDSILIADRRDASSYKITGLTIRNITFNTKIDAGISYAIKYVDMQKNPNGERVNFVIENNTFNNKINGADPVMFVALDGTDITNP